MFQRARVKLTVWYLTIIMAISLSFSLVIYVVLARELTRGFRRAELRFRAEELNIPLPRRFSLEPKDLPWRLRELPSRFFVVEDLEQTKRRLAINLLAINGGILFFSTIAGYFLAGKTLRPIETALEEQKRFVADASHELRTPLTALKTSLEVSLRDKKMALGDAKKLLKDNLEEVENLKVLSDKLLSLTRYQSNGQSLEFEKIDIKSVLGKAFRKISPLVKEKGIRLNVEVKSQKMKANEESLTEMILIFLDNAVKFTPQGGKVTVTTKTDKKYLFIEIKDTGMGIEKKDLPFIFDRFFRADQSRSKEKVTGFGLGLSLAKRIIEVHKGSVEVTSVLGKSTTFIIKLPL